jgi:7-cyano-7-deazaguanine synthase
MAPTPQSPSTGLLLSGGIDSAVLLAQLLERGWQVVPFYVETGCAWQECERTAIDRFLNRIAQPRLSQLVVLQMPLADLYGKHWSITGTQVPDDSTPDEAVYLPGRNPLLLIKPAIWCAEHKIEHLALATLAANPFHDATQSFFRTFEEMLREAVGESLHISRPFERLSKLHVLEMRRDLPLELTFSCLSPAEGMHCGHCNKCAERQRAFHEAGIQDRTTYHDHPGLTTPASTLR